MLPLMYGRAASPACRAVLMTAKAIKLNLETKEIDVGKGQQLQPEYLKLNPQHTIPTLDDNGFIIWDSHVITTYLINKYAQNDSLYPKDVQKRALVDLRLHFDNTTAFASLLHVAKPLKQQLFKTIPEDRADNVRETYRLLNLFLEGNKFVTGDTPTVADFHLVTTITSLDFLVPIGDKFVNVNNWLNRCKEFSWYESNVQGLEDFRERFRPFME